MMPPNSAIAIGVKRCAKLYSLIEAWEKANQIMDALHRNEMGAWRRLMFEGGMEHHQLPEMPFLDPAHLEAYKVRCALRYADQEMAS